MIRNLKIRKTRFQLILSTKENYLFQPILSHQLSRRCIPRKSYGNVLSSTSDKRKSITEKFSRKSDFDDSCETSTITIKLHNIHVTPELIMKVITSLDLSEASGPDCIPVVLKNFQPELSHTLAEVFKMSLKESCFPDS